jgi:dephospho-CoA kinase
MSQKRVGLTGGIATGKSYVLGRLRDRGIPTIDADDVVHEALGSGTPTANAIAAEFGAAFLGADGGVDRVRLGARVFSDSDARSRLEAIVHPVVYEAIRKWFETLDTTGVASIPLLFETHREKEFDLVVATVCPPDQQMQRIVERDGLSEENARARIAAQMPADEKAARADFVIRTGGSKLATDQQVEELVEVLRKNEERQAKKE